MVSRCRGGGNRRIDGKHRRWYWRRKHIEIQQRSRDRNGKAGANRALGTVPMLIVIDVTSAVTRAMMMAAVVCVLASGIQELNELRLRARGAQDERAAFPDRGRHVAQRRQCPAGKSDPRQPGDDSDNSV